MNAEEFYKDFFGVEPKENSTTINQSVLAFAEQYAKHYAAETLSELERVKEQSELHRKGTIEKWKELVKAEKERDELREALRPFQNFTNDFSKENPSEFFTMTIKKKYIAKAQFLTPKE